MICVTCKKQEGLIEEMRTKLAAVAEERDALILETESANLAWAKSDKALAEAREELAKDQRLGRCADCTGHKDPWVRESALRKVEKDLAAQAALVKELRDALRSMLLEDGMEGIGHHCRVCGVSWGNKHEEPCCGTALDLTPATASAQFERKILEAKAEAFEEAADRCQTRSTDGKMAGMPTVLVEELHSRWIYFLERAKALRSEKP